MRGKYKKLAVFLFVMLIILTMSGCVDDPSDHIYIVTFSTDSEDVVEDVEVQGGTTILEPNNPIKEGHSFMGWYSDSSLLVPYDFSSPVLGNIELHATWSVNEYVITVYDRYGVVMDTVTYLYGDSLSDFTFPLEAQVVGYNFVEWDTVIPESMPSNDLEINPIYVEKQYRTLIIDTIYFGEYEYQFEVDRAFYINDLDDIEGISFGGWFMDEEYTTPYNLYVMPEVDTYVYALWTINTYTVEFRDIDNVLLASYEVLYGTDLSTIQAPIAPEVAGYVFDSWSEDLIGTMPAHNLNCVTNYSLKEVTLTFESNGGSVIDPLVGYYSIPIDGLEIPSKEDMVFAGWYIDEGLTVLFEEDVYPADNQILYAKWIEAESLDDIILESGIEDNPLYDPDNYGIVVVVYFDPDQSYDGWNLWSWDYGVSENDPPFEFADSATIITGTYDIKLAIIQVGELAEDEIGIVVRNNVWDKKHVNDIFIDVTAIKGTGVQYVFYVAGEEHITYSIEEFYVEISSILN